MEGKMRAAAACCILIIVLLYGQQQQVAALTFCQCYKDCYTRCRKDSRSKSLCGFDCFVTCPLTPQPPVTSAGHCAAICQSLSICGVAAITGRSNLKACVDDCTNKLRGHARSTAVQN
ncbi:hypothetical protein QOZ80_8BG0659670 [Eleusine coracana subsp. coracana]|nr:hypothetical protein QOZ80_8BG0659670 [Eleusine coracana subsp. coracana]